MASSTTTKRRKLESLTSASDVYDLLEVVGEGTFSVVRMARARGRGGLVAVKRLKKVEQAASRIRDEVGCLLALRECPHIVDVLDCARDNDQVDIIMP